MLDHARILLCYDGSDQAIDAIDFAARFFPNRTRATVLHAWEPSPMAINGEWAPPAIPPESDQHAKRRARSLADAGARYARDRGLDAEARVEQAMGSPWRTIIDVAESEYDLIVMGTRGFTGVGSLLAGSISHHVAQHATCPVLIVPAAEHGGARRRSAQANGHAGRDHTRSQ
jgi:nucleotide-binding universal stress UspA family protein